MNNQTLHNLTLHVVPSFNMYFQTNFEYAIYDPFSQNGKSDTENNMTQLMTFQQNQSLQQLLFKEPGGEDSTWPFNFMPFLKQLKPYLSRNQKKDGVQSLAEWTNILRNVTENDLPLDSALPKTATSVASLQGYCTFFVRKLGITAKRNEQHQWQAFYNQEVLPLSPILAEAIVTKEYEIITITPPKAITRY